MKFERVTKWEHRKWSPSLRREWIEIWAVERRVLWRKESPSMRREWIEMRTAFSMELRISCLPPCGGSGLKCLGAVDLSETTESPSMRREWIEIQQLYLLYQYTSSLPPCGGSGLKSVVRIFQFRLWNVSLHAEGVD